MVKLTFYGGVDEIGGNKILLEDQDTRVFLDFGMSFSKSGKYYAEFLQPRTCNGLGDLMELGIIPDVNGIYRNDLLENENRPLTETPQIDGVLLSHAHADHSWHISLLHKDIPIFCSNPSKLIMKAAQETSQGNYYMDFYYYRENFVNRSRKPKEERPINVVHSGKKFKIKDLEIEPLSVNHSVPGAMGFIIHTSEGPIIYTGDYRFHGRHASLTKNFVQRAKEEKPIALITEGTRVNEALRGLSELQVHNQIIKFVNETKNLVVASFPPRDIDRFTTFSMIAKKTKREFAVSDKIAYMLETLKEGDKTLNIPSIDNFKIYMQRTSWGRFEERDYKIWQRPYLTYDNMVTHKDVRVNQDKYILFCSFYDLQELIDVNPLAGSSFVYSLTEPFNEEMEIDFSRMKNWLDRFSLPIKQAHASGHTFKDELKTMMDEIKPKIVFPIHTEHPHMFKKLYKGNVQIVKLNEPYSI